MSNKETLFDQMTSVGMVYVILSQTAQMALNQSLTEEQLSENEEEARQISGMKGNHLCERSFLAPLIESFFSEIRTWLKTKANSPAMMEFIKMFNGESSKIIEEKYELPKDNAAPRWHQQILEIGNKLMRKETVSREAIGSLFRNIPADTTFGYLAILFLMESMEKSPNAEKLALWWFFLSGEKPFLCKVEQKGLFSYIDFLPLSKNSA